MRNAIYLSITSTLILLLQAAPCFAGDSLFNDPSWDNSKRSPMGGRASVFRRGANRNSSLFDNKNFITNTSSGLSSKGRSGLDFSDVQKSNAAKMPTSLGPGSSKAFSNPRASSSTGGNRTMKIRNGSTMEIGQDGTRSFMDKNGMQTMLNPDGTGSLPNGSTISKDAVSGSTTMKTKQGYGFTNKSDGSKVFTRTNGIQTVFTPGKAPVMQTQDGHVVQEIK